MQNMIVRPSAVSGYFYPSSKHTLLETIENLFKQVNVDIPQKPKAIISPHAGYIYSGPIAAHAYKSLIKFKDEYDTVLLLGPSHYEYIPGLAYYPGNYFQTPIGFVPIDEESIEKISRLPFVYESKEAHDREHSLEVQLPFLQYVLDKFHIIPLTVGKTAPENVYEIIKILYKENILILISSDLSHYLNYKTAKQIDEKTAYAIETLQPDLIHHEQACGRIPIQGLLLFAKEKNWKTIRLDLRNSGDTAGDKQRVVGYGSWCFI